jgi:hypothetical protein
MSRWADEFKQHPFQATWSSLKGALHALDVDDKTIPTDVAELARLKRVVSYLDEMIANIDPDITPKTIWGNFHSQTNSALGEVNAFTSNRNISHLRQANDYVDNLLTYLKPFAVLPSQLVRAVGESARVYISDVDNYVAAFADKAAGTLAELKVNKTKSDALLTRTEASNSRVEDFTNALLKGTAETPPVKQKIEETKIAFDSNAADVEAFHSKLLVGNASTKATIELAEKAISDQSASIVGLVATVTTNVTELGEFHTKIFGVKDPNTGKSNSGLEFELGERTAELVRLEKEQVTKHKALSDQIESLLPGATSAGLASAYGELEKKFAAPIKLYTQLFYGALSIVLLAALVMSVEKFSLDPWLSVTFVKVGEWDFVMKALLYKAPFIAPAVWLAIFASTRRSQYERLQQEYAHKEAFARSYESYKKQLMELKGDTDDLQKNLIAKAIDAIAYNASVTLDGKHKDKLPLNHLLDKVNMDEFKKGVDIVKGAFK